MDLSLEIEQALSVESRFGVGSCCTTMDDDGVLPSLVNDVLHSDEQCVRVIRCPLVVARTGVESESVRFPAHGSVLIKRQAGACCSSHALRPG